ncbi:MAG: exo-alpha-sialidase [Bacteroidaceae bacterium]|nr:exo-alpha-sialidase [Bacteroidaceae bacterium]
MKKLYIALITLTGLMGGMGVQAQTSADDITYKKVTLFSSAKHTSTPYRIPAIATLNNGQVLVIADHRPCGADVGNGEVDIYAKVGTIDVDGSYTWDPETDDPSDNGGLKKIADGTSTDGYGYGDAAVAVDPTTGHILVLSVGGTSVFGKTLASDETYFVKRHVSTDNGNNWTTEDITSLFKGSSSLLANKDVGSMFFASGRMLASRKHPGRIYAAILTSEDVTKKTTIFWTTWSDKNYNYVFYTDDLGKNWKMLGDVAINDEANEAKLEELPNGDILISSRKAGGRYFNIYSFEQGRWLGQDECAFGSDSGTNGELLMYPGLVDDDGNKYNVMFQSLPTEDSRSKVSVFYKAFDASTTSFDLDDFISGWTKGIEVDDDASAYSTMTILPNGEVGFLYEDDYSTSQGASGGTANIVYVPLTVEELTNNAYKLPANLTIGPTGYATFFAPYAVNIPEGITAKYVNTEENSENTGVLKYTELQGVIPANTAVVLKGEKGNYTLTTAYGTANVTANNALFGYAVKTPVADNTGIYALAYKNECVAFYPFAGSNYAAGKAYLNVNKLDTGSEVRSFALFDDDNATAIETLPGQEWMQRP